MFLPGSFCNALQRSPLPSIDESLWYLLTDPPAETVVADPTPGGNGVNLGMLFTVGVNGVIKSVCYYRWSALQAPNGTVAIWRVDHGQELLLDSVDFTGHSGVGWQKVDFPEPIKCQGSFAYKASIWLPVSADGAVHYASTRFFFQTKSTYSENDFIVAWLADGRPDPRGFIRYNSFYKYGLFAYPGDYADYQVNYWVDVVVYGPPAPDPPLPPLNLKWPILPGYPSKETTGVPPGTVLTPYRGEFYTSYDGQIVENLDVTDGGIRVQHNNVTVRKCRLRYPGNSIISVEFVNLGTIIEDCEIDGTGRHNWPCNGIRGAPMIVRRNNIYRVENGFISFGYADQAGTTVIVEDNFIHNLFSSPGGPPHYDNLQFDGGQGNVILRHNTLFNEHSDTSAIMLDNEYGVLFDFLIEDNLVGGGGYALYCITQTAMPGANPITNIRYNSNKMHQGRFGYFTTREEAEIFFAGNQHLDHGGVFDQPPVGGFADGQVVPESFFGFRFGIEAGINGDAVDAATGGVTIGLSFTPKVDGVITGLNVFRPEQSSTTTLKVGLWRWLGSDRFGPTEMLGSETFTNITQTQMAGLFFTTPIAVEANDNYVIGLFIPRGHDGNCWYMISSGYFWPNQVPSQWGRLTAFSNANAVITNGFHNCNGMFSYGPDLQPPIETSFFDMNYWVDPVFVAPAAVVSVTAASVTMNARVGSVSVSVGDGTLDAVVNAVGSAATATRGTASITAKRQVTVSPTGQSRTASVGTVSVSTPVFTGWPDSTNTGYLHAPGYPGSLTPWPGGSLTAGATYSFYDFPAVSDVNITVANVTFIGCRFQSNWVDGWQIKVNVNAALAATFKFCTIRPPLAVTIPHSVWPSGGTGIDVDGSTGGGFEPYQIDHDAGYQYGIYQANGGILVEDCDFWGFGNAIVLFGSHQKTIRRTWIHDAAAEGEGAGQYHTDGIGHLDGGGVSNVLIEDCTIATLGNTNGIAFQTGTYNNIIVRRNFLSGFGVTVDMCHNTAGNTNLTFQDNTIATDVSWHFRPIYTDFTSNFSGATNLWRGNRIRVLAGTVPRPGSTPSFTIADHNKFILPSGSLSTTDYE